MASIMLPGRPGLRAGKPRLLDFGVTVTPPLGGPVQRINRLGNRFAIDVTAATCSNITLGPVLISRLVQGVSLGVILPFPQDMPVGAPGAPVIAGNGQMGTALALRSFTPEYQGKEGQFFSIVHANRRYLHLLTGHFVADATGALAANIWPPLRIAPADGDVCEFGRPLIEGFMTGQALEWQLQAAPYMDVSFTVEEAA